MCSDERTSSRKAFFQRLLIFLFFATNKFNCDKVIFLYEVKLKIWVEKNCQPNRERNVHTLISSFVFSPRSHSVVQHFLSIKTFLLKSLSWRNLLISLFLIAFLSRCTCKRTKFQNLRKTINKKNKNNSIPAQYCIHVNLSDCIKLW